MTEAFFYDWSNASTEQQALDAMTVVAQYLGCSGVMLSYAPTGWLPSDEPGAIYRTLQAGVNERLRKDWMALSEENRLQLTPSNRKFDPIRRRMVKQTIPHSFDVRAMMDSQLTAMEQRWCKSLLKVGVDVIVAVPVQLPPAEYWALTLLATTGPLAAQKLTAADYAGLMFFAHGLVQFCIGQLHWHEAGMEQRKVRLRPRERDCLYWAARGKSAAETADILELKTETVRKYLKTALARLNSQNKVQAVAKALQWGLLELSDP